MKRFRIYFISCCVLVFLSGCAASDEEVQTSIETYLYSNYKLSESIYMMNLEKFLFAGADYQADVRIDQPYPAYLNLTIDRDTIEVIPEESDSIYFELFKGAYIEQHPEIMQFTDTLLKKYQLVTDQQLQETYETTFYHHYLHVNIEKSQERELIESFKKTQTIDTNAILPTLVKSEPERMANHLGVINFIFQYDLNKNKIKVPQAQTLVKEFQKSNLLKQGIYHIAIQTVNSKTESGDETKDSSVLFRVDGGGGYTSLPSAGE